MPSNAEDVRKFLGFAGYYRKFIKDFAKIARSLIDIMAVEKKQRTNSKHKEDPKWKWKSKQQHAFDTLKEKLTSSPILAFPNFSKPLKLHTDACQTGLGAVLYQCQDGVDKVIDYAIRGLSRAKKNYPTHKLEFLAFQWATTEKYSDYLQYT